MILSRHEINLRVLLYIFLHSIYLDSDDSEELEDTVREGISNTWKNVFNIFNPKNKETERKYEN